MSCLIICSLFPFVSETQQNAPAVWKSTVPSMHSTSSRLKSRNTKAIVICRPEPQTKTEMPKIQINYLATLLKTVCDDSECELAEQLEESE